jgi:hypothetical protein
MLYPNYSNETIFKWEDQEVILSDNGAFKGKIITYINQIPYPVEPPKFLLTLLNQKLQNNEYHYEEKTIEMLMQGILPDNWNKIEIINNKGEVAAVIEHTEKGINLSVLKENCDVKLNKKFLIQLASTVDLTPIKNEEEELKKDNWYIMPYMPNVFAVHFDKDSKRVIVVYPLRSVASTDASLIVKDSKIYYRGEWLFWMYPDE